MSEEQTTLPLVNSTTPIPAVGDTIRLTTDIYLPGCRLQPVRPNMG